MILEQHALTSSCGEFTREVWLLPSTVKHSHRLCIFLDAEHYLRDMNCLPVLEQTLGCENVPPMTCLFVSHLNGQARHFDLTCNRSYGRFIAEDVVAWARQRNPLLYAEDNLICGLSLSGLEAAYVAFHYPAVFPRALCQSGSFWWLGDHEVSFPPSKAKLWLSVGSEETATQVTHPPTGLFQRVSQIEGVEAAARKFESLGAKVRYNLYAGGHAMEPWKNELGAALQWLFAASTVREATIEDVPVMFEIRLSVQENAATREQLEMHGIDEAFVAAAIRSPGRGWIAEDNDRPVGFCIADCDGADILALFVLPEFEGRGHGGRLLDAAVRWLLSQGVKRVTLATGAGTRSHSFYMKRGWKETGRIEPNGDVELALWSV